MLTAAPLVFTITGPPDGAVITNLSLHNYSFQIMSPSGNWGRCKYLSWFLQVDTGSSWGDIWFPFNQSSSTGTGHDTEYYSLVLQIYTMLTLTFQDNHFPTVPSLHDHSSSLATPFPNLLPQINASHTYKNFKKILVEGIPKGGWTTWRIRIKGKRIKTHWLVNLDQASESLVTVWYSHDDIVMMI